MHTPAREVADGSRRVRRVRVPWQQVQRGDHPALTDLVESGTIRILDLLFMMKEVNGDVEGFELRDLPEEIPGFDDIAQDTLSLLSDEDLAFAADSLEPNSSGALLVIENVWAERLANAIRDADGEMYANARIPAEVVDAALAELAEQA